MVSCQYHYPYPDCSQGSQASNEISWLRISCTLHSAVPQLGRLLQQPYIASVGVTPRESECRGHIEYMIEGIAAHDNDKVTKGKNEEN